MEETIDKTKSLKRPSSHLSTNYLDSALYCTHCGKRSVSIILFTTKFAQSIISRESKQKKKGTSVCLVVIYFTVLGASGSADEDVTATYRNNINFENYVLLKLIKLEEKTVQQETRIESLTEELREAKEKTSKGSTYIRWGRTTCTGDAQLVYEGYAGGSSHTHSGAATNPLCLPTDPIYDKYANGFQYSGRVYGAEYETTSYNQWKYLNQHDVPCVVCRIPRSDVLMIPGKNVCHKNYVLEYKGYLMSGNHNHQASSEYVCVDRKPEVLASGVQSRNGKLFYFVESVCGSLQCPPYINGRELTCAVCSYSPYL